MKILLTFFVLLFSSYVFSSDYITKKNKDYITKKENPVQVSDKEKKRTNDLYKFTLNVTIGTILHEIGHALIDKFDIPIFNNEEDVADSFLTYYLINMPSDFDDNEEYRYFSKRDHGVLMDTADYYYFNSLLGKDNDKDFSSHSTDNRRFFNILCNMKDGNPDFFKEYLLKRNIEYLLNDNCSLEFDGMRDAWYQYVFDSWIQPVKPHKNFNIYFEDYSESILGESFPKYFEDYFYDTYGIEYLEYFQIKFPGLINVTFKSCGVTNGFYVSKNSEILICYELLEEYYITRDKILDLKKSL